jgi:hypothetical protein
MTLSSRRLALAAVIVAIVFVAGFLVRKASAGGSTAVPSPTPVVLSPASVKVQGVSLPQTPPALHHQVHHSAPPTQSSPGTTSVAPTETPPPPVTPNNSAPPSGGGGGKVIVG